MKKIKLRKKLSYLASLKPISVEKAHHDYFNAFIKSKFDIEKRLTVSLNEASVLIIGCGYKYPDVLLFSYFAKEVYGLDVVDTFYRDGFWALYRSLIRKGKTIVFSFLKAFAERNSLGRNYYKQISKISTLPLNHSDINLISYDGIRVPFENNKFDVVISTAVLEHVVNLKGFFQELSRITKPGGLSYHLYHNYYSFSGSHLPISSCKKHPWGHLRGVYKADIASLNKATIEQISRSFSSEFIMDDVYQVSKDHSKKGIDKTFRYEGQNWLTENIRNELKQYTDE